MCGAAEVVPLLSLCPSVADLLLIVMLFSVGSDARGTDNVFSNGGPAQERACYQTLNTYANQFFILTWLRRGHSCSGHSLSESLSTGLSSSAGIGKPTKWRSNHSHRLTSQSAAVCHNCNPGTICESGSSVRLSIYFLTLKLAQAHSDCWRKRVRPA